MYRARAAFVSEAPGIRMVSNLSSGNAVFPIDIQITFCHVYILGLHDNLL